MRDNPAALPSGQASSLTIAIEGIANSHAVNGDRALDTADGLPRKGEDMLQDRNAQREISLLGEISSNGVRQQHENQVARLDAVDRMDGVEANRHAGTGVPDQLRGRSEEN